MCSRRPLLSDTNVTDGKLKQQFKIQTVIGNRPSSIHHPRPPTILTSINTHTPNETIDRVTLSPTVILLVLTKGKVVKILTLPVSV